MRRRNLTYCLMALCLLAIGELMATGYASWYPGFFEDSHPEESSLAMPAITPFAASSITYYAPNGYQFTPKGNLRILIICAGFGAPYDSYPVNEWPVGNNTLPNCLTNPNERPFYSAIADFDNPLSTDGIKNISRYYYEMSGHQLRIMADVLPMRINVADTLGITLSGLHGWVQFNQKVLDSMKIHYPNFNWAPYDQRKNSPMYEFDSSDTLTNPKDNKPDFIVFMYRFKHSGWPQYPKSGMQNWWGSGGGFSSASIYSGNFNYNGYSFDGAGYTQCNSETDFASTLIHEMAHCIFKSPHYGNANGVTGNYFYGQTAWGTMNRERSPFSGCNAWERWYMDWIDGIKASGANADIKSAADLNTTGEYTLRDHYTTGDAFRLKIPNGTGENQYLWLERHTGASIFDNRTWLTDGAGNPFPPSPQGVVGHIESINDEKIRSSATELNLYDQKKGNTIKVLHPNGNYDYTFDSTPLTVPPILWHENGIPNKYYRMYENEMNPVAGQSRAEYLRNDFDLDGTISQTNRTDTGNASNEHYPIHCRRDNITGQDVMHDAMGAGLGFPAGAKLSMASNPALVNRPQYDDTNKKMGAFYLNGISVEFLTASKIKVHYNDVDIDRNTRYAGFVHLPRITAPSVPDIRILSGITLKIDKSGTPNRHTKTTWNDFVNLTEFICDSLSYFQQLGRSTVVVEDSSLLVLEGYGTRYELKDSSTLVIRSGSTLMVRTGSFLWVRGRSRIDIEPGGYLCVDPGANVLLEDTLSVINLKPGSVLGKGVTNSFSAYNTCNCTTSISQIKDTGQGAVNLFGNYPYYIQNATISRKYYAYGDTIRAGRDVIPSPYAPKGDVILQSGSNVIFDASGTIFLEGGFEVKQGAAFEAK